MVHQKTIFYVVLLLLAKTSIYAKPAQLMIPPLPLATQQLPNDASFCIVDLKYHAGRKDRIKICELGQGLISGFIGHHRLFGKGKIWKEMWRFFSKLNLPITLHADERKDLKTFTSLALDSFITYTNNNITTTMPTAPNPFVFLSLSHNYIVDHYDDIKAQNPKALILDDATRLFVLNKALTHIFFKHSPTTIHLRPACKILPKYYDPEVTRDIITTMPAAHYVIKPISGCKGNGIVFVEQKKLDITLKSLFAHHKQYAAARCLHPDSYAYWRQNKNNFFIIESYEPSQAITVHHNVYDATMRVAFGLAHINGVLSLDFFGAYWKLPKAPLGTDAPFDMQHQSHIELGTLCSAPVDEHTYNDVKNILTTHLPTIYRQMIAARYDPVFIPIMRQQLIPEMTAKKLNQNRCNTLLSHEAEF